MILFGILLASCAPATAPTDSGDTSAPPDDACFLAEPSALIGTGETSFEELSEGDTVYMQHGSQGGEHILGSIRLWNTDGIAIVHYTIARKDDGSVLSDQTFRVAMIAEADCVDVYTGMYGYLGFTSETTFGLQNTAVILRMDATDSAGRSASDEVGVLIGMIDLDGSG
ncbi:MAG: hypothetical protein Q8P18_34755 [Pseudomonadota bacterium]|nr:hypothetical protein [Pseudomonadota bacterium]